MQKKRIILLHHVPEQGGGTKSLIDIAVMLQDEYDVVLCLPKGSGTTVNYASQFGIVCTELKTPIPTINAFSGGPSIISRAFIRGLLNYRKVDSLVEELMSLNPDVIIMNSLVTSIIAKKIPPSVKIICFIRETLIRSPFTVLLRSIFNKHIDGVAYIAEHEKRVFNLKNPLQVIIPDVVKPDTVKQYGKSEARVCCKLDQDRFYVLYMGGSAKLKGFDTILSAATNMDSRACVLILGNIDTGRFTIKNAIMHLHNPGYVGFLLRVKKNLKRLENDPRICMLGYRSDISALMCASDVIVFPSSKPHQPRPCIEAGIYGKPVILSDFEATREYFMDGYNALVFSPNDGADLAEKITMLMHDPALSDELGEHNRLMSAAKHDYYSIQGKTLGFIKEIVQ